MEKYTVTGEEQLAGKTQLHPATFIDNFDNPELLLCTRATG